MKLTRADLGRVVAYRCQRGTGTGRIHEIRGFRVADGQSAFMVDLTGPLAEGGTWTWIHENCLTPTTETDR